MAAKLHGARVFLRLRGDPFAETRDQLRFHWQQREWPQFLRSVVSWLLDRPLFAAVDRFVPVSDWIVRRLHIQDRASIVRIPVAIEDFPPRQHRETSPLRLLSVTNFNYPQKVAALGRFLESYGDFLLANGITMTIAGTGIAWETFRARHAKHAQFPGFVRDVAGLYAEHDVFVHFSDLDAFPYVVLEAQAAGLPVIVNPACGMLEQVEDNVNGFLADLEDRSAVESLLLRLRDSVSLRSATRRPSPPNRRAALRPRHHRRATARTAQFAPVIARTIFRAFSPSRNRATIRDHGSTLTKSGFSFSARTIRPNAFHRATGSDR